MWMSSIIVISVNTNNIQVVFILTILRLSKNLVKPTWAYQKMIQSKAILINIASKVIKNKIIFELEIERLRDFMKI